MPDHESDHDPYVERVLELARAAADNGNDPFGALLVQDGEIVTESENTVETDDDITANPELKLARWAASELDEGTPTETTLFTSIEPCARCAGAIYIAGLQRIVYSVSAGQAAELVGGDRVVPSSDVFERRGEEIETPGPVRPEAGARIHEECWPERGEGQGPE